MAFQKAVPQAFSGSNPMLERPGTSQRMLPTFVTTTAASASAPG
jgi:hypothetical protein